MSESERGSDEMPVWVRRLIYQLLVVVVVIGGIYMVKHQLDNSDARADRMIECEVYERC